MQPENEKLLTQVLIFQKALDFYSIWKPVFFLTRAIPEELHLTAGSHFAKLVLENILICWILVWTWLVALSWSAKIAYVLFRLLFLNKLDNAFDYQFGTYYCK